MCLLLNKYQVNNFEKPNRKQNVHKNELQLKTQINPFLINNKNTPILMHYHKLTHWFPRYSITV